MRLIDADALIAQLKAIRIRSNDLTIDYKRGHSDGIITAVEYADDAPTADAVPVVRGEWIVDECDTSDDVPSYSWIDFHCSECNTNYGLEEGQYGWCRYEKIPYNFCPNCGADMRGSEVKE